MAKENEDLRAFVQQGAGWTDSQKHDRDCLEQKIEAEKEIINQAQSDLLEMRQKIDTTESKILNIEQLRGQVATELQHVEKRIEDSNDEHLLKQANLNEVENRIEGLVLQLREYQEQLQTNKESANREVLDCKTISQSSRDAQLEIDKCRREFKELEKKLAMLTADVEGQNDKSIELEKENNEKLKIIEEKANEATILSKETVLSEKKKEMIIEKISDIERMRIEYEEERDDLKLKLNKLGSVELKMIGQEIETQKRQSEALEREMSLLDRKKTLTEKSSSLVKDIIASNTSTLKSLQNELESFSAIAKRHKREIQQLQESLEKEREGTATALRKRAEALKCLLEQEAIIEDLHKQLESAEITRKQKQNQCDAIKTECNVQAKRLAENHDVLEQAKRETELIKRQTKALKIQIASTENNTVIEHYNHHHTDEEKHILKTELNKLRSQIAEMDEVLERNEEEISKLGNLISEKDRECDRYAKEYSALASNRDLMGSLLVQKSAELEKLQEKIKGQQSVLHHGELQYSELVSSIQGHILNLKELIAQKEKCSQLDKINNELRHEAHALENEIHSNKLKTVTLRDELGRPTNIHRWRSLEHRDPEKFEKIKQIQRLQKQIIATTEKISEKDILIREQERAYEELQRASAHQPQFSEVQEQLDTYQCNLSEKFQQLEQIELELEVQKRRVSDLSKYIRSLECDEKRLVEDWVEEQKQKQNNESFASN